MSDRPGHLAEITKDHALVHFFALMAAIDEIDLLMRLLASGIASFVSMDAVALGFSGESNLIRVKLWHRGADSELRLTPKEGESIETRMRGVIEEFGYPLCKSFTLVHLGKKIGCFAVGRQEAAQLTREEEFLLTSLQTLTSLLLAKHSADEALRQSNIKLASSLAERQRAQEEVNRRNRVLDGINRIFQEVLKCETEEELGQTCLKVVEEITASKFGFVAEIGADGLLHDLAISDPGWEACTLHDKTGPRRVPFSFKIHGLYGRVLREGRSLIANAPTQHPDSIGTPAGHPPLTAFLGVPLFDAGRLAGMIAVGNREGGYRQEELETLEALAPAVVEALQRKRTEEALIRSEKLVSVGRLAATIAHEINNPLEGATNALFLVSRDPSLSGQSREMADIADRELRRAAQIARRTLGFYREPNARMSVVVSKLLREVATLYETQMKDKSVHLRVRCADESAAVIGNTGEMRQLFSNLLANSIDAVGRAGTVHVRVSRRLLVSGTPRLRISVADTGRGIEPHNLKRIFEPFFTTKKDVGTGLGLWISEQIVKKHGGTIRVRSRVGHGTVFSVTLPASAVFGAAAGT